MGQVEQHGRERGEERDRPRRALAPRQAAADRHERQPDQQHQRAAPVEDLQGHPAVQHVERGDAPVKERRGDVQDTDEDDEEREPGGGAREGEAPGEAKDGSAREWRERQESARERGARIRRRLGRAALAVAGVAILAALAWVGREYYPLDRLARRESPLHPALKSAGTDLVVLAGLMRVLKAPLLDAFPGRIINLHPSLLPAFPGLDGIGQAWRAGVAESGCTVHWVNAAVDGGDPLGQARVARQPDDTLETFAERIHAAEHRLLPEVIARLSLQPLP